MKDHPHPTVFACRHLWHHIVTGSLGGNRGLNSEYIRTPKRNETKRNADDFCHCLYRVWLEPSEPEKRAEHKEKRIIGSKSQYCTTFGHWKASVQCVCLHVAILQLPLPRAEPRSTASAYMQYWSMGSKPCIARKGCMIPAGARRLLGLVSSSHQPSPTHLSWAHTFQKSEAAFNSQFFLQ